MKVGQTAKIGTEVVKVRGTGLAGKVLVEGKDGVQRLVPEALVSKR